jgi:hypothetical protein
MQNNDNFGLELERLLNYVKSFVSSKDEYKHKEVKITPTMYKVLVKTLEEETKKEQSKWLNEVRKRLNDKLPPHMHGKLRQPRTRLFPYRVSGDLYNKIASEVAVKTFKDGIIVHSWVEFKSIHAIYTDSGVSSRSDAKWIGWMDDILRRKGRGNIMSFTKLMNRVFRKSHLKDLVDTYLNKKEEEIKWD